MKYLAEKLIILVICALSLYGMEITHTLLAGGLLSTAAACFFQVMEKRKTPRMITELCYAVLALIFPEISYFAALSLYEAARAKDVLGIAVIAVSAVRGAAVYGHVYLIPLALCILSVYMGFCAGIYENRRIQLLESRDNSVETERLLKNRNRELKENMDYTLKINTLNERNRIAREIHDNVGHILSRSILSTGALAAVCPPGQKALKDGLNALKNDLDSAMESIRKSVHDIRDDSFDLKLTLDKMTAELKKSFKTEIMYDVGDEMPIKIKIAFTAILKEAISNILKHSNGDKVQITVREHPALYQLIVCDNGTGGKTFGDGMGIDDMRQRAEDINGIFRVASENGFTVFVAVRKELSLENNTAAQGKNGK